MISKFGTAAKIAKGAGYLAIVIDVGFGIYDNIHAGAPTEKIVSVAAIDTTFGLAGILVCARGCAIVGSIVLIGGNIVGACSIIKRIDTFFKYFIWKDRIMLASPYKVPLFHRECNVPMNCEGVWCYISGCIRNK